MSLIMRGRVARHVEREAGDPSRGGTWIEYQMLIQAWGSSQYVKAGKDFGTLPPVGSDVEVEVVVQTYVKREQTAKPSWEHRSGHTFVALRLVSVEVPDTSQTEPVPVGAGAAD